MPPPRNGKSSSARNAALWDYERKHPLLDLPLIFLGGLLGSSHCIGMCGGFALSIGGTAPSVARNLSRQAIYSSGRIFSYACAGALAGYGGMRLADRAAEWVNVPACLAVVAGVLLIWQGLVAAGVWPRRVTPASAPPCLSGSLLATFLRSPEPTHVFLAGLFTGLLPCGLVYAYLALASSSGGMAAGLATMAAFGLGTVPLMVLTGIGGSFISLATRQHLLHIAAWCVVLTGIVAVARGLGFVHLDGLWLGGGCPACQS
ncbi:MAG: sulfite exporter TauE/SafE family protein [Pirellulales bacterium]|nr:sulfite exporter TauE/SafE family protein [Pirellulales bacterium]